MIRITPEAALEIVEGRAYYREHGADDDAFANASSQLLDEIETRPAVFPAHPFATTAGTKRALFPAPWPFAFAYIVVDGVAVILACEHLRREPGYWTRTKR
jgi:hypothetical protein